MAKLSDSRPQQHSDIRCGGSVREHQPGGPFVGDADLDVRGKLVRTRTSPIANLDRESLIPAIRAWRHRRERQIRSRPLGDAIFVTALDDGLVHVDQVSRRLSVLESQLGTTTVEKNDPARDAGLRW
jgi:hypothetical protein